MEESKQICNDNFQFHEEYIFPEYWKQLKKNKEFYDGIIKIPSGKTYNIHRIILSACSPYFRANFLYKNNLNNTENLDNDIIKYIDTTNFLNGLPIIQIDATDKVMEAIIEYAYAGNCLIDWSNVDELLASSDRFEVIGLVKLCCKFLYDEISIENCIGIYLYTNHYYCYGLEKFSKNFILKNFVRIIKDGCSEFQKIDLNSLTDILLSDYLNIDDEHFVFTAIKEWIEYDLENRGQHAVDLLPCIRFGLDSSKNLLSQLVNWAKILENVNVQTTPLPLTCRSRLPNELIFVIGGWNNGSPTNLVEVYDTRSDIWLKMRFSDENRAYHGMCEFNKKIYIIGGFDGQQHYNTMRCYNPLTYKWEEKACMHYPRCYVTVAVLDSKIYALGGYNGSTRYNSVERYDPFRNQWEMVASMKNQRSDAAATTLENCIYIVGGFNGHEVLNSCEVYDPSIDNWSLISSMQNPRSGVGLVVCNDYLYAIGGFSGHARLNSVERYSPNKNPRWHLVNGMMVPRSNFACEVVNNKIFVIGGFNGSHTIRFVEKYEPDLDDWKAAKQMNYSRSAQNACVIKDLPNIKEYCTASPNEGPCYLTTNFYRVQNVGGDGINNEIAVAEIDNNENNHLFWEHGAPEPFNNFQFNNIQLNEMPINDMQINNMNNQPMNIDDMNMQVMNDDNNEANFN